MQTASQGRLADNATSSNTTALSIPNYHNRNPTATVLRFIQHAGADAMISSKLSRALPRVAASTSTSSPAALSPASTSQGSARRLHQRRHSSSKTSSCPPDNSSPKAAQAAKSAESTEPHDPLAAGEKGYRKKLKTNVKAAQAYRRQSTPYKRPTARASKDATAGLPSVPQLHGMQVAGTYTAYLPVGKHS